MFNILLVALDGACGAAMRYLIGLLPLKEPFEFHIKTFAVNILGCFLIGLIVAFALKPNCQSPSLTLFLKSSPSLHRLRQSIQRNICNGVAFLVWGK
ncbi:MAG: CrcB family protein [Bacteroidales bacterium]|nr:CrcB family protein [Bacteroidales bacterium]